MHRRPCRLLLSFLSPGSTSATGGCSRASTSPPPAPPIPPPGSSSTPRSIFRSRAGFPSLPEAGSGASPALSSIAQPGASTDFSSSATYVTALTGSSANNIVQSFEATGGYELRLKTAFASQGRSPLSFSAIADGGMITPLSYTQASPTLYVASPALQAYYTGLAVSTPSSINMQNGAAIAAACPAATPAGRGPGLLPRPVPYLAQPLLPQLRRRPPLQALLLQRRQQRVHLSCHLRLHHRSERLRHRGRTPSLRRALRRLYAVTPAPSKRSQASPSTPTATWNSAAAASPPTSSFWPRLRPSPPLAQRRRHPRRSAGPRPVPLRHRL